MAMTSTAAWRRRLRRNWQRLHSAIYVVVPLAILHLAWLRKDGFGEVFVYALWFLIMLLERWWWRRQKA
ncbi:MAG TPA: sulfoxide reductase heme-binding subunit YedZ, partial [Gammaproteobacteria bacterium]|nr:sulfoxide reductase heme-binding subunit YedZ [Gammaproteobacteria bacterium]